MLARLFYIFVYVTWDAFLLACKPKNLKIVGLPDEPKRSVAFTLELTLEKCPKEKIVYYEWQIRDGRGRNYLKAYTSSVQVNGYDIPTNVAFSQTFTVTASARHKSGTDTAQTRRNFKFVPEPMHIEIDGGNKKSHPEGIKLVVDAEKLSKDLSFPPSEYAFSKNKVNWYIDPSIPVERNFLVLEVSPNSLEFGKTYNFTVNVVRDVFAGYPDSKTVTQMVTIVGSNNPVINIECARNCLNPHPKEKTRLKVVCMKNCKNLNYKWTVQPYISKSQTEFGDGYDQLVIEADAFIMGDEVTVQVESGVSSSTYNFAYVESIKPGKCDIQPKTGISGTTKFTVSCQGFQSQRGIMMYLVYQKTDDKGKGIILNEDAASSVSEVYLTEGNPARVTVVIQDNGYVTAEVNFKVTVLPFSPDTDDFNKLNLIKKLILDDSPASMRSFAVDQKRNKVVQMMSYLLDALEQVKKIDNSTIKFLHKHIARYIEEVEPHSFHSSQQIVSALKKLEKARKKSDTETAVIMSDTMKKTSFAFHRSTKTTEVPLLMQYDFTESILGLFSDLIQDYDELDKTLFEETPASDYGSYGGVVNQKVRIRRDLSHIVKNMVPSMEILAADLLRLNAPEEKEILLKKGSITLTTRRVYPSSLARQVIRIQNVTGSNVKIREQLIDEFKRTYESIDYQFSTFASTPFWWHPRSFQLNADIVLFNLYNGFKRITGYHHDYEVNLQILNSTMLPIAGVIYPNENMRVHRVSIRDNASIVLVFHPTEKYYELAIAKCYCTDKDFLGAYQMVPGGEARQILITPKPGQNALYVCMRKSEKSLVHYLGLVLALTCVNWPLDKKLWTSKSCYFVRTANMTNAMQCKCLQTGFITGLVFQPIQRWNEIYDTDFVIIVPVNLTMLFFVIVMYVIWFILLIFAYSKDKTIKRKNVVCLLDDNVPGDKVAYLMVVSTGFFYDAGTTADVAFRIYGEKAKSRVHLLKASGNKLLERNSQDWVILFTPCELGPIKKIRIWHNCRGRNPHWYCNWIIVQNLKSGDQYYFRVKRWFSLIWGTGKIRRELYVRKCQEPINYLFPIRFESRMKNEHYVFGLLTRDPQSNYSTKERICCDCSNFILSMAMASLFFNIPTNTPSDSIDPLCYYDLSLHDLVRALETFAVVWPLHFLTMFIFKNSAPKRGCRNKSKKYNKTKNGTNEMTNL